MCKCFSSVKLGTVFELLCRAACGVMDTSPQSISHAPGHRGASGSSHAPKAVTGRPTEAMATLAAATAAADAALEDETEDADRAAANAFRRVERHFRLSAGL